MGVKYQNIALCPFAGSILLEDIIPKLPYLPIDLPLSLLEHLLQTSTLIFHSLFKTSPPTEFNFAPGFLLPFIKMLFKSEQLMIRLLVLQQENPFGALIHTGQFLMRQSHWYGSRKPMESTQCGPFFLRNTQIYTYVCTCSLKNKCQFLETIPFFFLLPYYQQYKYTLHYSAFSLLRPFIQILLCQTHQK